MYLRGLGGGAGEGGADALMERRGGGEGAVGELAEKRAIERAEMGGACGHDGMGRFLKMRWKTFLWADIE